MIRLSNDHEFEFMAASGALGFDGKGWTWEQPLRLLGLFNLRLFTGVIKTLTRKPRKGNLRWYNPFGCIRFLPDGIVNAVGLTNPGIKWWCQTIGHRLNSANNPLMGSILGEISELVEMARMLNDFDLVGLEINASCPNTEKGIIENTAEIVKSCEAVKRNSRFPIILKLSFVHDVEVVPKVKDIVEAFSINSVPWSVMFPNRQSPLEHLGGGGVSGKIIQPFAWGFVRRLVEDFQVSMIAPSIWEYEDIGKVRVLGAKAISFGSIFLRYPWRPTIFVRRDIKERR